MTTLTHLLDRFQSLYWTDKILAILIGSISMLFLSAMMFAVVVIGLRVKNRMVRARWLRLEKKWEERLLDVLADATSPDELRSHVAEADQGRFVDFLMRFARQLRGSERATLRALAEPYLPAVAQQLASPNAERRARTVLILSGLGGAGYDAQLLEALDDESPLVAMVAARALANSDHSEYAGRILTRIDRFERWSPRHLAAMFAGIGDSAAPSLRATLMDTAASDRARVVAAESLLLLRDFGAAEVARTIAGAWAPPDVLVAVLRLLAATGSGADAAVIRSNLSATHSAVRGAAMSALGAIGDESDLDVLARSTADSNPWVALNAATALRDFGALERLEMISRAEGPGSQAARELLERNA